MKRWMYVVTGIVVVAAVMAVILGVRFLAPERPAVENHVPGQNGNVVHNGVDGNADNAVDNGVPGVETATSIQLEVEWTNDETVALTYRAKDIGTENFKSRMDGLAEGLEVGIIINGELGRAWSFQDGEWVEIPDERWDDYWEAALSELDLYISELQGWTHGDCTFTHPDYRYQVRIYDVEVNPDLPGTLFEP